MASLPNSPATKAKGKTPLRGGIVAKNKTLLAAGPEEGEAKSSRAATESARLIEPPSSGVSVARDTTNEPNVSPLLLGLSRPSSPLFYPVLADLRKRRKLPKGDFTNNDFRSF